VTDILVAPRSEIDPKYTWNAPSVFESDEAWEEAYEKLLDGLKEIQKFNPCRCF
jgi:oligoendopeptidase F